MPDYFYQRLRAAENHSQTLIDSIRAGEFPGQRWGAFTGLFGLAGNEVILINTGTDAPVAQCVESQVLTPTARPAASAALTKPGLYVFRRFLIDARSVAEFVELSVQAWETFEGAADFTASPQGLFKPPEDKAGHVDMLLVTWYDGFASWQTSRQPSAAAAANFRRRHALTLRTSAIATQLVTDA